MSSCFSHACSHGRRPVIRLWHQRSAELWRSKSTQTIGHSQYCMNIVKKNDHENYLSSLLLPKFGRTSAFAIRAFNVAVSQIQDNVSEKQIGMMRLHFWKETIGLIYKDEPPEQPIAQELAVANRKHKLSKHWFLKMIESREEMLTRKVFRNISEVENYAEMAFSSPIYLILECLGIRDVNSDHVASHIGRSIGLTTLMRAVPYNAQRSHTDLPMDVMMKHNVSQEEIYRGCHDQKVKDVIFDVACTAHRHLDLGRQLATSAPPGTHLAMLGTASCDWYLTTLRKVDFDIYSPKLQTPNPWLPYTLLMQKFWKKY